MKMHSLFEFVADKGIRGVKNRLGEAQAIGRDDPLRKEAEALVIEEATNLMILKLLSEKRRTAVDAATAEQEEKMRVDEAKRIRAIWAGGNLLSFAGLVKFFAYSEIPVDLGVVNAEGRSYGIGEDEKGLKSLLAKKDGNKLALFPTRAGQANVRSGRRIEHFVLMVKAPAADRIKEHFNLPTTLCWESDGWVCWLYRGTAASPIVGGNARVVSSSREPVHDFDTGVKPNFAPFADVKWRTKPSEALPKDSVQLPEAPEAIAQAVVACGRGGDAVFSRILVSESRGK